MAGRSRQAVGMISGRSLLIRHPEYQNRPGDAAHPKLNRLIYIGRGKIIDLSLDMACNRFCSVAVGIRLNYGHHLLLKIGRASCRERGWSAGLEAAGREAGARRATS